MNTLSDALGATDREILKHLKPHGRKRRLSLEWQIIDLPDLKRMALHTADPAVAIQKTRAIFQGIADQMHITPEARTVTISRLCANWKASDPKRPKSEKYAGDGDRATNKLVAWLGSDKRIIDFTSPDARQFFQWLQTLSFNAHRVNGYVRVLRSMFQTAVNENWISENPFRGIKLLKEDEKPARAFLPSEILIILNKARTVGHDYDRVIECFLWTGMRLSELLNLEWKNVDLTNRVIYLGAAGTKESYDRRIPINSRLHSVLVYMKSKYKRPLPMGKTRIDRDFWNEVRPGGNGDKFHGWRKTCESLLAASGLNNDYINGTLGWKDRSVRASIYNAVNLGWATGVIPKAFEEMIAFVFPPNSRPEQSNDGWMIAKYNPNLSNTVGVTRITPPASSPSETPNS